MLEIAALFYLSKKIGELAESKGESAGKWKAIMIGSWFASEILGVVVIFSMFGEDALIQAALVGLTLGVTSYFVVKSVLSGKADEVRVLEEEVKDEKPNLDHFR